MNKKFIQSDRGFTLLEMAVVVLLLSLITGGSLSYISSRLETERREKTEEALEAVREAVIDYAKRYGNVPCPANGSRAPGHDFYGIANPIQNGSVSPSSSVVCNDVDASVRLLNGVSTSAAYSCGDVDADTQYINSVTGNPDDNTYLVAGVVPVYSLNIDPKYMFDGWNRKLTYVIDDCYAMGGAVDLMKGYFPSDTPSGKIQVKDNVAASGNVIGHYAVLVMSHGRNGFGAWTRKATGARKDVSGGSSFEDENADFASDAVYTDRPILTSKNSANYFDDMLTYIPAWQLE